MRALVAGAALAATSGSNAAQAVVYSFQTIDVPGGQFTEAAGINDAGVIAGSFGNAGHTEGFVRSVNGTITPFLINGSSPSVGGINNLGQIVGTLPGSLGFIRNADGSFVTFALPVGGAALDINNSGAVVGYSQSGGVTLGFIRNPDGSFLTIDDPASSLNTVAQGINNHGAIVGNFNFQSNAFLRDPNGTFMNFQFPGAIGQTAAFAINDLGDIGGFYDVRFNHGFVRFADGTFQTVDDPFRGNVSQVLGINDSEDLVGLYIDGNGVVHGYLATPLNVAGVPELGTWAMMLIGFGGIALRLRCRNDNHVTAIAP